MLYPYLKNLVFILHLGRGPLLLIALWRPGVCHYFYYYQCLITMVKETLPVDGGQLWNAPLKNEFMNWFASYSMGDMSYEMLVTIVMQAYV